MEIKASADYDKKAIIKYTRSHFAQSKIYTILSVLVAALCLFVFAVYLYGKLYTNAVQVLLTMILFFVAEWTLLPYFNYKQNSRKNGTATVSYIFTEDKLIANTNSCGTVGKTEINYSALIKVTEVKEYWFIYITKAQGFIVDKSTVTDGTVQELRALLIKNTDNGKYKMKCKA